MEDCLFCRIVAGAVPAALVYEDEVIMAFKDIKPQAPVHILIIPRDHFASLNDIDEAGKTKLGHLLEKTPGIAAEAGVKDSGYRLVLNTGRDSGQEVRHIHFHLLGGRRMTWPPG